MNLNTVTLAGVILILLNGMIHLIEGIEHFGEDYRHILFLLNTAGAVVAAIGIARGVRSWGWSLGLFIAAASIVLYVISRTVGLPNIKIGSWSSTYGILSLIVESLFVALALRVLTRPPTGTRV